KLDGRMDVGRWVGFEEASFGHRVYWPERRTITVERSVKFNFEDTVTVPLEGEVAEGKEVERSDPSPSTSTIIADSPAIQPTSDPLGDNFEPVEGGRGQRIRKPSEYVRRLRSGEGTVNGRIPKVLPKGLQDA
ncbi:hypothetical protein BDW22DRAFT_1295736, partial [Trametopsis cervina]